MQVAEIPGIICVDGVFCQIAVGDCAEYCANLVNNSPKIANQTVNGLGQYMYFILAIYLWNRAFQVALCKRAQSVGTVDDGLCNGKAQ